MTYILPPQEQAKIDAFSRIASKRVAKTIKAIRGLQPLASPNYIYTPEQVTKIIEALKCELVDLQLTFDRKKVNKEVEFSL